LDGYQIWSSYYAHIHFPKFHEDQTTTILDKELTRQICHFVQIKGHNFTVVEAICLFFKLGRENMPFFLQVL